MPTFIHNFIANIIKVVLSSTAALTLTCCQLYHHEMTQGNIITAQQITQLAIGQDKATVQEILGTTALASIINKDRWDYLYIIEETNTKELSQETKYKLSLFFKNNKLSKICKN